MTAPTPERRVGEARVREIERMLSMLTAPASELVPLKVDGRTFADMKQVFADWLALTAEVEAIEAAVREVCPLSDNEGYEDEDAGAVVYRCIGEDGDPLIETESRAEVIRGLLGLWHRVSDRAELLSHDFDELSKAFAATLAQDEIAHLNRECLKLGEDNQRLTAEVERLRVAVSSAFFEGVSAAVQSIQHGVKWDGTQAQRAVVQSEAALSLPTPAPEADQ